MCVCPTGLFSIGILYTFKSKMIALELYFTIRFLRSMLLWVHCKDKVKYLIT